MNREGLGVGVVVGHRAAALHGHVLMAMLAQFCPHHPVSLGEDGRDIAEGVRRRRRDDIGPEVLEDWRARRVEGLVGVGDGRELVVLDLDKLQGVLGEVAALGHHDGDRVADQPHLVGCHDGELDGRRPEDPRRWRAGGEEPLDVFAGHGHDHARQLAGRRHVDAEDAGVGQRAAQEGGVEHAR